MTFADRVYTLLRQVPKGRITTYKAIGDALGTKAYRAVGHALKTNPFAPYIPCHRVVSSNGNIGGFMGSRSGKHIDKKISMLKNEGVTISNDHSIVNFSKLLHSFDTDEIHS